MALSTGTRLGPYEVVAPLGAGGMGEVYRARDPRLGREVAIKVLPPEVAADPGRLKRFEKEERSASALNHPNIVTVYDIGQTESTSWIAMERVEGETLRKLLFTGPLPVKKLLRISTQIADGLARAHEAGIVHRDLKPENVMVTRDGHVKILDFGLAKLTRPGLDTGAGTNLPTETGTSPGVVLGTVGYMSPEQASGLPVDFRSDQFAFGSILYEMATGKRAFQKGTTVDTLSAILHEEPKPVAELNPQAPAPLRWIIEQCLSKQPPERYASTTDLARELRRLRDHSSEEQPHASPHRIHVLSIGWPVGVALLLGGAAVWLAGALGSPSSSGPAFRRLTFHQGNLGMARFAPDGQTVVYSASWAGSEERNVYLLRIGSPESRLLFSDADFYSISDSGELAVMPGAWTRRPNLLSRVPLEGGAPREVIEDVAWGNADWAPGGKELAVVRSIGGRNRLEFPIGRVIYETNAAIRAPRFSSDGRRIAFFQSNDSVHVIDVDSADEKVLSTGWLVTDGVPCWARSGKEIWFTAARVGESVGLWAVKPSGIPRLLARVPGNLELYDVSREGRILVANHTRGDSLLALAPGDESERDLSWLDQSSVADLSRDGKTILFSETGEGGGPESSVYVRQTDGLPAKRLGEGIALALSPDARWVVAYRGAKLILLPTGPGEPREIGGPFDTIGGADWHPDGSRIVFSAKEKGKGERLYVEAVSGGKPRPISSEGVTLRNFGDSISPEGRFVVGLPVSLQPTQYPEQGGKARLYPLEGGAGLDVPGLEAGELPVQWSSDGESLYVYKRTEARPKVWLLDVTNGRRRLWKEIRPPSTPVRRLLVTPDGRYYAYGSRQVQSQLFLVEGLN